MAPTTEMALTGVNRAKKTSPLDLGIKLLKYTVLIAIILLTVLPFIWGLSTSLRPSNEIVSYPPKIFPTRWTLENYVKVVDANAYLKMTGGAGKVVKTKYYWDYVKYSMIISAFAVALSMLASSFAGYAASRYNFRGKNVLMFLILAGMAIGRFTNAMPLYFFSVKMGLFDTIWILVISYAAFITPLVTWLMQSYFDTIPKSIEEAAKIDGCNTWTTFWRVIIPVMGPAIVAGSIISLSYAWNEFILSLVMTKNIRTLPVQLYLFINDMGVDWGSLTAAAFLSMIPILIVFFALQKYFLQGLTAGTLGGT
jgi:multiple sugar transport system permease protein